MQLNEYGFITHYLVSGRKETPFTSSVTGRDQLQREKLMRQKTPDHDRTMPGRAPGSGGLSSLGLPWDYEYVYGSWFVDRSSFYPLLTKVELHGATVLTAPEPMTVACILWSYAAVDVWNNGEYAGGIDTPVYKPITRKVLTLNLKAGRNLLYIRLQNLGVRDTRSLFGLQIPGEAGKQLMVELPDMTHYEEHIRAGQWLSGIRIEGGKMYLPWEAPAGAELVYDSRPADFEDYGKRYISEALSEKTEVDLRDGFPYMSVRVFAGNSGKKSVLSRQFERQELHMPVYSGVTEEKENIKRVFDRIAGVGQIPRGETESFSLYPILGRLAAGTLRKEDEKEIYKSFDQIESRRDCSDFLTCALVRLIKLYPMDQAMADRCKEVCLNYRYWMDEDGSDGMCFWSENHSLMFYVSAYMAGDCYNDDLFIRSGRTGLEMKAAAGIRIRDWMTECVRDGFDEFHSGGYTPITFAAILNVVDFGDEELSGLAAEAADRLLGDLAYHAFCGVSVAPMGRVYREVLYPCAQDIQCLLNLMDPESPDRFSEWIIFLATSRYKIPSQWKERMKGPLSVVYSESNARICVERTQDYMLTSVQSPRQDGKAGSWEHVYGTAQADPGSFSYVKSLNECFHGTTRFEPGVFGYQQHMWYAALDPAAVVFVNHPGGSCEACSTRPGYWFGNGIMPALKQDKNVLLAIYRIPDTHPIPFTHLYWPESRFSQQKAAGQWIAGKAGGGYVGIWCSRSLSAYDDQMFHCEYRADGRDTAYVCVCRCADDYENIDGFLDDCRRMTPQYRETEGRLAAAGQELVYRAYSNETQYV